MYHIIYIYSGFVKFFKDQYTTLPDVDDRFFYFISNFILPLIIGYYMYFFSLFGTIVKAEWEYSKTAVHNNNNYNRNYDIIKKSLIGIFLHNP